MPISLQPIWGKQSPKKTKKNMTYHIKSLNDVISILLIQVHVYGPKNSSMLSQVSRLKYINLFKTLTQIYMYTDSSITTQVLRLSILIYVYQLKL